MPISKLRALPHRRRQPGQHIKRIQCVGNRAISRTIRQIQATASVTKTMLSMSTAQIPANPHRFPVMPVLLELARHFAILLKKSAGLVFRDEDRKRPLETLETFGSVRTTADRP